MPETPFVDFVEWSYRVVFAEVEDSLKHEVRCGWKRITEGFIRSFVSVEDGGKISVCIGDVVVRETVLVVRPCRIKAGIVFLFVEITSAVALVVKNKFG